VRIRFDARQLVADDVRRLLDQAQPLDNFMRENPLTDGARNDWSTLRANLSVLANAYNVAPSWINNSSSQTGYKGTNRLTGTFKLDSSRSDNPRDKARRATQNVRPYERHWLGFYSGQRQPRASDGYGAHDSIDWAKVKISRSINMTRWTSI
jgi:hypothetical protein